MTKNKKIAIISIIAILLIALVPMFILPDAEFGGSDGMGADLATELAGEDFEPWFTPVIETAIGGELSGEIESLFFCVQTGIGVGIIAYTMGWLVARKKFSPKSAE